VKISLAASENIETSYLGKPGAKNLQRKKNMKAAQWLIFWRRRKYREGKAAAGRLRLIEAAQTARKAKSEERRIFMLKKMSPGEAGVQLNLTRRACWSGAERPKPVKGGEENG